MSQDNSKLSRRQFLSLTASGAAVVAGAGLTTNAHAKSPKAAVAYQETPKNGNRCDECKYWVKGGECTKVKGDIAAAGWCAMYQPA
jgi:hypothetical protein